MCRALWYKRQLTYRRKLLSAYSERNQSGLPTTHYSTQHRRFLGQFFPEDSQMLHSYKNQF